MPPVTEQQEEAQPAHQVGGSADLLAACFARLPLAEQAVTVGCLSHAWKQWAAPRREELMREVAACAAAGPGVDIPPWYVMEAWGHLSMAQRSRAALALARSAHLEVLQWAARQQPPCPWEPAVCRLAAGGGHLDALQWLRQQQPPCPWDASVCAQAARGGHLEVLQWARQQQPPCPWSKRLVLEAAKQYPAITAWVAAADDLSLRAEW